MMTKMTDISTKLTGETLKAWGHIPGEGFDRLLSRRPLKRQGMAWIRSAQSSRA